MLFSSDEIQTALHQHLVRWGLKRFTSDADYFAWQRRQLSLSELNQLNDQVERKRSGDRRDEVAFYDLSARSKLIPVLYSQRYEYYGAIGLRVASRLGDAERILDFGCGVGILTTFYASRRPDTQFMGVDRSPVSIAAARQKAREQGLANVRFECVDMEAEPLAGSYDLVIATHALVQAEQDPGIPSRGWQTFERARDAGQQAVFEQRTGIGVRLDRLGAVLNQNGRMIVFEKARQLARRVPFQRALAARGFSLVERPEPIRYLLVEEVADDGPFYVLRKGSAGALDWDESPEPDEGLPFDPGTVRDPAVDPDAPLYENHWPSAQRVWEGLKEKQVTSETTRQESDGRQLHVESGTTEDFIYLYCANTFDQRQLILIEAERKGILESYYQEITSGSP